MLPSIFLFLHNIWLCSTLTMISLKMFKGARPDGDLAVPPELEAYFSVDAQVALTVWIMELLSAMKWTNLSPFYR